MVNDCSLLFQIENLFSEFPIENFVKWFSICIVCQLSHFIASSEYDCIRSTLFRDRKIGLQLHHEQASVRRGMNSELMQIASKIAQEFKQKYPVSIVWTLACSTEDEFNQSLSSLAMQLQGLSAEVLAQEPTIKKLSSFLEKNDFYVLLICNDYNEKVCQVSDWNDFIDLLKINEKVHFLASTQYALSDRLCKWRKYNCLTDDEAIRFLSDDEDVADESERKAMVDMVKNCNNLFLELTMVKEYCKKYSITFVELLDYLSDEENKQKFIEWKRKWQKEHLRPVAYESKSSINYALLLGVK